MTHHPTQVMKQIEHNGADFTYVVNVKEPADKDFHTFIVTDWRKGDKIIKESRIYS